MISKSELKLIKSLNQKKYRQKELSFFVEGKKSIEEFLKSNFKLKKIFTVDDCFDTPKNLTQIITQEELKKISSLVTPNQALAIFEIPPQNTIIEKGIVLALDDIRDPGNLGTIIRLCDWFGVTDIICSLNTVDCFNPKVVQASMGSLTRVHMHYMDLSEWLNTTQLPKIGTFLSGENIYQTQLPKSGVIILGNEARGISEKIEGLIDHKVTIPQFGQQLNTESLNVATATAIVLSEFVRRSK